MAKYTNQELVNFVLASNNIDNDAKALTEIIKLLREKKKFGIVWEDSKEDELEQLRLTIPYLTEDKSKELLTDSKDDMITYLKS